MVTPPHEKQIKKDGEVTIIIAAYMRYESLNLALQSVYHQSYKKWNVLIVADYCKDNFINNVDLSNPKVKLINLPVRCGNQYGPNSVGIYLANTEYTAFLNHDDIWLSDHLEIAVHTMKNNCSDFFLGKSATCYDKYQSIFSRKKNRLHFSEINHPEWIWRCLFGPNELFEPVSSWVLKTHLASSIGYWSEPSKVTNTPLLDWLSRAAQKTSSFSYSKDITTLKFNLHPFLSNSILSKFSNSLKSLTNNKYNKILILKIDNKLNIWLSYITHFLKSNSLYKTSINIPSYFSENINLEYVKLYLRLDSNVTRKIIKQDLRYANKYKLSNLKYVDSSIKFDKLEHQKLDIFYKYIKSGVNNRDLKNSTIYTSKLFKILTFDRTGELFESYPSPKDIIDELIRSSVIPI